MSSESETPTLGAEQVRSAGVLDTTLASGGRARRSDDPPRLAQGDTLGRYVVLDLLGHGGMGVVYAAYDRELDRKVAIKLVKYGSTPAHQGAGHARLLREAQALARLTHPNIVGVYDVGTWEQSIFVAMEFIEGETIARWIDRRHADQSPPWREVLTVMLPAGRGLAAAHAAGLVHRDFKPENVMLAGDGRVLVLDFGIARVSAERPDVESRPESLPEASGAALERLTMTGSMMGTPAYMSPEQLGASTPDEASDQFSFCVSLYHALYGERPFAGQTLPELAEALLSGRIQAPPSRSNVPAWLRRVVLRGLATDPSERYRSMTDLLDALEHDPDRIRRRLFTGVALTAMLGGVWFAASHGGPVDPRCDDVSRFMQDTWGPPQRQALERAFRLDAMSYSEQSLERVEAGLDRYAADWTEVREAVCEQESVEADAQEAYLATACLDELRDRFEVLVRLFGDADQDVVIRAISGVQALPQPAQCRDGAMYRRWNPLPEDPADQERVESIRLRLTQASTLDSVGRAKEALDRYSGLIDEAEALGFDPLIGEVLWTLSKIYIDLGRHEMSIDALERTLLIARAHDLDHLEANALELLIFVHLRYGSPEMAQWHLRVYEVINDRLSSRALHEARLLELQALLEQIQDHDAKSVELFERALALYEEDSPSGERVALLYSGLALSYIELQRLDDAARVLERGQAIAMDELGPDHPFHANLLMQAARIESARNNPAGSADKLRATLKLVEGAYGPEHPNIGAILNGLALQLETLGHYDEATASFRRAIEITEKTFGKHHRQVTIVKINLANLLRRDGEFEEALRLHRETADSHARIEITSEADADLHDNLGDDLRMLGRCDEAEVEYRAAIALRDAEATPDKSGIAYARRGIGLCRWKAGDPSGALEDLEAALAAVRHQDDDPWLGRDLAIARFCLAMVLREQSMEPERVATLTAQAEAFWKKNPVEHRVILQELRAWKAGGPAAMPTY